MPSNRDQGLLIVLGRFRSGTTLVWNAFRSQPGWTAFLEPLHEHLIEHVRNGIGAVDPSHRGVSDYWGEYRGLNCGRLEELHRPWFAAERFRLESNDAAGDLFRYLDFLVGHDRRVMLKLTRADFRAPWLRAAFPDARIIQLVRNPRALWTSYVGRDASSEEAALTSGGYGSFLRYHQLVMDDLGVAISGHPYRQFFVHSLLSAIHAAPAVDATWRYEDICTNPTRWLASSSNLLGTELRPTFDVDSQSLGPRFHAATWFEEQENAAIDELYRVVPSCRPTQVDTALSVLFGARDLEALASFGRTALATA